MKRLSLPINVIGLFWQIARNIASSLGKMKKGDGIAASATAAKEAEQLLISDCAIVPLYERKNYYGNGKKVSGVIHNISGEILYFKNVIEG